MEPVRWGVLGVATHFTLRVATPLLDAPEVQVVAIASRSKERAREAAERWDIPRWYGSYAQLLADREIEAVYIPLPNHLHLEWVRKCAEAGKHVLCEKPLALNAEEAAAAVQHARRAGVLLMEAFMYRFHPQWRRAFELVRAGEIGEVRAVHTAFGYSLKDPSNIRNRPETGGGAVYDIGCYAVSVPRFLFGREPARALALVERDPDLETDILTSAILDFGAGRSVFTIGTQLFGVQRVDVLGTGGRLAIGVPFNMYPDVPPQLTVTTSIGERSVQLPAADQYGLEFAAFSRALREGLPAPTPPQDAVNNQKVLDALFRSEKSGAWEEV